MPRSNPPSSLRPSSLVLGEIYGALRAAREADIQANVDWPIRSSLFDGATHSATLPLDRKQPRGPRMLENCHHSRVGPSARPFRGAQPQAVHRHWIPEHAQEARFSSYHTMGKLSPHGKVRFSMFAIRRKRAIRERILLTTFSFPADWFGGLLVSSYFFA